MKRIPGTKWKDEMLPSIHHLTVGKALGDIEPNPPTSQAKDLLPTVLMVCPRSN